MKAAERPIYATRNAFQLALTSVFTGAPGSGHFIAPAENTAQTT